MVAVHGVGQQLLGEESLLVRWRPALLDGLRRAGHPGLSVGDLAVAFYGDIFRPEGDFLAVGEPRYGARDVEEGFETELLFAWWAKAAAVDEHVVSPDTDTLAPRSVQAALRALPQGRYFTGVVLRALVSDLKQTTRYLLEPGIRAAARARVATAITADTRVVVAHSLGSVVAYEVLCSLSGHGVRALVTLGSPLGTAMIFDRLDPAPASKGPGRFRQVLGKVATDPEPRGVWPGSRHLAWTNVADGGDVVALEKDLRPWFGEAVINAVVHNGSHAHEATAYLTDKFTGTAIARGLELP
ncbi:hypothetical protein [Embleya sp. NPDC059237]|uniref:hypothetical protein n=1 Tax=Embleya sp. NPDC059237 TaxID=3346784 RepID=UPI0036853D13